MATAPAHSRWYERCKLDRMPRKPSHPSKLDSAARRLGIQALKAEQRTILEAVLGGRDALVVLPTGFGKSACYQIPSLLLQRPVVVSPLTSERLEARPRQQGAAR
jgi:hypothetical protein